ncbi:MAG: hypothetical protein JXR46_11930 [Calditrichaceae bacterium]|nr:hypothetical protein [Calditrichaceae bacterium]MBN2709744.1 hypothetical protein [Calditrichaceae bacterium]RQV94938.1 MAG: acetyl xylan esterase [Calditrichota bacterium]
MRKTLIANFIVISIIFISGCSNGTSKLPSYHAPDNPAFRYTGRIDFNNPLNPKLISAGSYIQFGFKGTSCDLRVKDQHLYNENYNYLSIVIDGEYKGRISLKNDSAIYKIAENLENKNHTTLICKATEASIGYVEFSGVNCSELIPVSNIPARKIEFIGNSITCGMGLDLTGVPCDSGKWFDQHNAYLAYGPLASRRLNADWLLSSVSGLGVFRNWNSPGPTLPMVYQNLYLNTDSTMRFDVRTFKPDLISICLGTNDFSDGDGSYKRTELDSAVFVEHYINFVKYIRHHNPQARICCLTSPMNSGEKNDKLKSYISAVVNHMQQAEKDEKINMFAFTTAYINGCGYHPDERDHQMMADDLIPFYKSTMGW